MKKLICAFLSLLVMMCVPALAMENLMNTALVGDGEIYYAGSLDGKSQGVFLLNPENGETACLYDGEASVLAGNKESVLISDYNSGDMILLDISGQELFRLPQYTGGVLEDNGSYYAGMYKISGENAAYAAAPYVNAPEDKAWMYQPVAVKDGCLYYLDSSEYGESGVDGSTPVSALMKADLTSGETTQVSGAGTAFIGMQDGRAVYQRSDFYVWDNDDTKRIDAVPGLYIEGENGQAETLLASFETSDVTSTKYSFVMDGVVYGMTYDYSQDQPAAVLKRASVSGETLSDMEVPPCDLCGAAEGKLYLGQSVFDEKNNYTQADRIYVMDLSSGTYSQMNEGNASAIYYSEATPRLIPRGDKVYYLDFDAPRSAVRLMAIDTAGQQTVLAQGYGWANVE